MIDKKSLLKMSKHVFRKSQGYPDRRLMHPKREWGIGLLLLVGIVIIGSIATAQMFVTYKDVGGEIGISNESIPQYRSAIVQDALEINRTREQEYNLLKEIQAEKVIEVIVIQEEEDSLVEGLLESQ